jgi:hypothetical protein
MHDTLAMTGLHDSDTAVLTEPCSRPQEVGFIIEMDCVLCELQARLKKQLSIEHDQL